MGRFNLRLRPVYADDEPTTGEGIARGVQMGLDWYAGRREAARAEGNEVLARGGERLPDEPVGGVRGRIQRGIGGLIRRIPGVGGMLEGPQPTGTFVESRPGRPGAFPMDEVLTAPSADDIVTDAILRDYEPSLRSSVTRPAPVGPRAPVGPGPSIGPSNGLPTLMSASPERTFEYRGSDGARYRLPQVGERERTNRMALYEREAAIREAADARNDERTATREYEHDRRMADIYEDRDERTATRQEAHDTRTAAMRDRLARLTRAGAGNSPEALAIRRDLADLAIRREQRITEQGAARIDASTAATEQRGVVTDPLDRRMLERNPRAKAENDARQARVDQALKRSRETANRTRNRVADRATVQTRAQALQRMGLTRDQIRAQMQAEGFDVR